MVKKFSGILLGKLIHQSAKRLRLGGGSAAPGLYALKLYPGLIEELIPSVKTNIVVTGTNGKTTTARLLAHFAKEAGLKVIHNATGSNLERGIASTLLSNLPATSNLLPEYQLGIWELDEAAFNTVAPKLKPDLVIFLNVFRDQLDRYGEVDSIVNKWKETLQKLPKKTKSIVNGDDANLGDLTSGLIFFGVLGQKIKGEKKGQARVLDVKARDIKLKGLSGSEFWIGKHKINLPLPGVYHIYDLLAAYAGGLRLGFDPKLMLNSLKTFQPAFGRVEKVQIGKTEAYIFLIKNPTGATQVFKTLSPQIKPEDRLLVALNDNLADGTDVSWIWDAEFEELKTPSLKSNVICSGTRCLDLALRLKYAGFDGGQIIYSPTVKDALKASLEGLEGRLFILPTYTALLELQKILAKMGVKKDYWR